MLFTVLPVNSAVPTTPTERAYLVRDNWNDWWEWHTMLTLTVVDTAGNKRLIGSVKIAYLGMPSGAGSVDLPAKFDELDDKYFSVGQNADYYEGIFALDQPLRDRIFSGLRDLAVDDAQFEKAKDEVSMKNSLLRSVSANDVTGRFRRLARGDAALTRFWFAYQFATAVDGVDPPSLDFDVKPNSTPPTNIHVLIGRNGVGKTRCLQQMTLALLSGGGPAAGLGVFTAWNAHDPFAAVVGYQAIEGSQVFRNIISVTFSAFDPFEPLDDNNRADPLAIPYCYVGLKTGTSVALSEAMEALLRPGTMVSETRPKNVDELVGDFVASVAKCQVGVRMQRWKRALATLEADPLFKEADVAALADISEKGDLQAAAKSLFKRMSSGHKIVLLTITRLVETVEEKSLVLLDEPEAHLHPPLLAAFVRSLSDLLIQRNGVAIIATHSPVVLQEAPKSCVSIMRRSGLVASIERPEIETFGENVGILTREVFGLEVTQSGFYSMLLNEANSNRDYEAILADFGGHLGVEAKAILRGLLANREKPGG